MVGGILGTFCGSELAKHLNRYTKKAEAIVCSGSLICALPFLYISLTVVQYQQVYLCWVTVFLAIFFVCLNWTPVSAMLLVSSYTSGLFVLCLPLNRMLYFGKYLLSCILCSTSMVHRADYT